MEKTKGWKVLNVITTLLLLINILPVQVLADAAQRQEPVTIEEFAAVSHEKAETQQVRLKLALDNQESTPHLQLLTINGGEIKHVRLEQAEDKKIELAELTTARFWISNEELPSGYGQVDEDVVKAASRIKNNQLQLIVKQQTVQTVILLLTLKTDPDIDEISIQSDSQQVILKPAEETSETRASSSTRESSSSSETVAGTEDSISATTGEEEDPESSSAAESTAASASTSNSTAGTVTSSSQTNETQPSSEKETQLDQQHKSKQATKALADAQGQDIGDLFNQYAPGDRFVQQVTYDPMPITDPNSFKMQLDLAAPEAVQAQMKVGDTFTLPLPPALRYSDAQSIEPIKLFDPNSNEQLGIATIDKNTNTMIITLTDTEGNTTPVEGVSFIPFSKGSVTYEVSVNQQIITHPGKSTSTYPDEYKLPPQEIFINPPNQESVSKTGQPNKAMNPTEITWNVDVNKDLATLDSPTLKETFPAEVTYKSLQIYRANMNFNGEIVSTDPTPLIAGTDYTVDENGNVQFLGQIDQVYRLVYTTTINDTAKPSEGGKVDPVTNKVTWAGTLDTEASVALNYGKTLGKTRTGYNAVGQIYSWKIQYNYGQKNIDTTTPLVDTFSGNMDLDESTLVLHYMTIDDQGKSHQGAVVPNDAYTVKVTPGENGNPGTMTIQFNDSVQQNQAIDITYQTKVNQVIDNNAANIAIDNQVGQGEVPPSGSGTTHPQQQTIIKHTPKLDVGEKIASYTIDINKNNYQLDNAHFVDTISYSEKGYVSPPFYSPDGTEEKMQPFPQIVDVSVNPHKVLKGAITVDGEPAYPSESGWSDVDGADYLVNITSAPPGSSETGQAAYENMTITFQNDYQSTKDTFQMNYSVKYNQFTDNGEPPSGIADTLTYKNAIDMTWETDGKPHEAGSSSNFTTTTSEANQGVKSGSYDPLTKKITWTILMNYNNIGIQSMSLNDPIIPTDPSDSNPDPENSQVYVPNSLSILRGIIGDNGNFISAEDSEYSGEQLGKNYITAQQPDDDANTLRIAFGNDTGNPIPGWNATPSSPMTFKIQFQTSLKGKVVDQSSYFNTATTEVAGVENKLPAEVSVRYGGQPLDKSGTYNTTTGKLEWSLWINQAQSKLVSPIITDTPSANQILDADSIQLYPATVAADGTLSLAADAQPLTQGKDYIAEITTNPATGQQIMTVAFDSAYQETGQSAPDTIERPYLLKYTATPNLASKSEKVTNDASLKANGVTIKNPDTQETVDVVIADGSGVAYGQKGSLTIRKVNEAGSPLAGAHLQLIRRYFGYTPAIPDQILYDLTTDLNGEVTFGNLVYSSAVGADKGFVYLLKELEAPQGYTVSTELAAGQQVTVDAKSSDAATPPLEIQNPSVSLKFYKENGEGQKLDGGLFVLEKKNDSGGYTPLPPLFAAAKIGVRLNYLTVGDYQLREVSPPSDTDGPLYMINNQPIRFSVTEAENGIRSVYLADNPDQPATETTLKDYRGSAELFKTDEEKNGLAGAQFTLEWALPNSSDFKSVMPPDGKPFTTDQSGHLLLEDLRPGKYRITESRAPDGYYLNKTPFEFAIDTMATTEPETVAINDSSNPLVDYKGQAQFSKTAEDGQKPLAGAVFALLDEQGRLLDKQGHVVAEVAAAYQITSDTQGRILVDGLSPGITYGLTEIKAPSDYVINDTVLRFTMPTGTTADDEESIENSAGKTVHTETMPYRNYTWKVYWQKQGQELLSTDGDRVPLGQSYFKIFKEYDGEYVDITGQAVPGMNEDHGQETVSIDGQETKVFASNPITGQISVFNLTGGQYYYQEVQAPEGYLLDDTEYSFALPDVMTPYKGQEINISPAVSGTTDDQGRQEVPVTISGTDQTERVPVINYKGAAQFLKKAADDASPLAGAAFKVYHQADNQPVMIGEDEMIVTSDEDGLVYAEGLAPGAYYFQETATPSDQYIINTTKVPFEISATATGKPSVVTITDDADNPYLLLNYKGSARLQKLDGEQDPPIPLAGSKFNVYAADGTRVAEDQELVSDAEGYVQVNNLAPGRYYFREEQAPAGYVLNDQPQVFEIPKEAGGQPSVVTVSATDEGPLELVNYKGQARLIKQDEQGRSLGNAVFRLLDERGNTLAGYDRLISDEKDGSITVKGLAPGKYRFAEEQAPDDYLLNTAELPLFEIKAAAQGQPTIVTTFENGESLQAINYRGSARLQKIVEKDGQKVGLPDAHFKVVPERSKEAVVGFEDLTSDAQGYVTAVGLAPGTYRFIETRSAAGYIMDPTPSATFTIAAKAEGRPEIVDVGDFINFQGTIKLHKTDEAGHSLQGAVFQLWDIGKASVTVVNGYEKLVSDSQGIVSATGIAPGRYELRELTAPAGYIRNTKKISVTIASQAVEQPLIDLGEFVNFRGSAEMRKTDERNRPLSGAVFALWSVSGETAHVVAGYEEVISDRFGKVRVDKLAPGSYEWREVKAPKGFRLNSTAKSFVIPEESTEPVRLSLGDYINQPIKPYPKTGEQTTDLWRITGGLILVSLGGWWFWKRKKRE